MRTSASVEVEAVRERWAELVNHSLEHVAHIERVDHRSFARQGVEQEPTVKMGHASAAIERRAAYAQQMAGEEPHAVTPRGQMNEAIREARGLGVYIERGREWLHEVGDRLRERAELAAHTMADLAREAAQMMRAKLQRGPEDGFEALPALDQAPRREHTPAIEMDRSVQIERDRQRQQERQRGLDGPDIGMGR